MRLAVSTIHRTNLLSIRKMGRVFLFLGNVFLSRFRDEMLDDQGKIRVNDYRKKSPDQRKIRHLNQVLRLTPTKNDEWSTLKVDDFR